ncbi:MAG: PHP domain-containing protein [Gammaproteobacteria bacterium]|nr:PHP domain-containing protein [Gammaproteobacteria bacterium]
MQPNKEHSVDLHSHTRYSDGSLGVVELLAHVDQHGVKTLAITDHDSIGAHLEIDSLRASHSFDSTINVIPGIEISTQFGSREVHIVGLGIDIHDDGLNCFVKNQQAYRRDRLQQYAEKLEKVGISGVGEKINSLTADSLTRTHLSQILVEMGAVQDPQRAFKRLIGRKGRAYVKAHWPSIEKVVDTIKVAGGIAVIAHPGRYQLNRKQLRELVDQFSSAGGEAIELSYPNAEPQMIKWLTELAKSHQLLGSQGADFHNPEWKWLKPGFFPSLPKEIEPVFERLSILTS